MDQPNACTEYATQFFTYPPNTISDFGKSLKEVFFGSKKLVSTLIQC